MIIYMLKLLTIIMQSSLTVVVLGTEWVSFQRLSPVEMILTGLGVCCFCQLWSSMLYNFCSHFYPNYKFWHFSIFWEFTNILSFWLTSMFAVFYCVKLSSFSHPIFWLKWRIVRLVPWLLLGSLLISCVSIIFAAVGHYSKIQLISMRHFPRNSTMTERLEIFLWDSSMCHKWLCWLFLSSCSWPPPSCSWPYYSNTWGRWKIITPATLQPGSSLYCPEVSCRLPHFLHLLFSHPTNLHVECPF